VLGGSISVDVITVSSVVGASAMVEVLESNDVEGAAVVPWTRCGSAGPLELGGCETLSLPVFVVAMVISLRLQLPVWVSWIGKARYLEVCFLPKKKCAEHP
jgi:hypothetical protein